MGVLVIAEGKTFIFRSALFVGLGSVVATIIYLTPVPGKRLSLSVKDMELSARTLAFRSSIIIGLVSAVATILYFTPLPDQYPQSCSRSCHELDWPMICRVRLTLERYQTLSRACGGCPGNATDCYGRHCASADGRPRGILTVNRQFPGPNLRVCQNDIIVVDVVNRVPGRSFGVHWRGQSQRETPHMDGVPMVTQCPIPSFTTFQYKFRASHAGTHLWQINTGEEQLETLFGGFIVRKPDSREIHRDLYDVEDPSHVITVHTLRPAGKALDPTATKLLINGMVEENGVPPAIFRVSPGKTFRFRLIFAGDSNCRVRVSVDDHDLLLLALDGNPIRPREAAAVVLAPGERADFALRADRPPGVYRVRARPEESCAGLREATAELHYDGPPSEVADRPEAPQLRAVSDGDCVEEHGAVRVCPRTIQSLTVMPKELRASDPRHKFFFFYNVRSLSSQTIYNTTFIALEDPVKIPQTNNLTMMFPPSPLLTQSKDVPSSIICDGESLPKSCSDQPENLCECTHIVRIRLGAVVELVLVNQDENLHVFHLHGYAFHVVGSAVLKNHLAAEEIRTLDRDEGLVPRDFDHPVVKDTIAVPSNGVAVLRFKANNPGYWLLDDEHSSSWSRGMSVVLHVGKDSDVPSKPKNFPECGNWIGPEFFLE